ncbi:protein D1-like [Vanessa cardui]|uniref:protein D1-like n=1 Tax=Vanessa cardui TaxID=171605 RepID=UPI001F13B84D|nr:protein D1-like [Vanessa cardui]
MYFLNCIVVSFLLAGCYGDTQNSRVATAFLDNKLVPNIEIVAPQSFITVNYSSVNIDLGTEVNPVQTLFPPVVSYEANSTELYTFMFFGPDLPIDVVPRYTQFLHWLIVNIPGEDMENGDTVSTHFPPTPYPGGFPYLFLLYKQNERIDPEPLYSLRFILNRPGFDPVEFKRQHNLVGPLAGNFMREQYLSVEALQNIITSLRPCIL